MIFNFLGFIDLTAIPWSAFGQLQQGNVSLATFALILIPIVSGLLNLAAERGFPAAPASILTRP